MPTLPSWLARTCMISSSLTMKSLRRSQVKLKPPSLPASLRSARARSRSSLYCGPAGLKRAWVGLKGPMRTSP